MPNPVLPKPEDTWDYPLTFGKEMLEPLIRFPPTPFKHFFFETSSHVAQDGLELDMQPRMILNAQFSCPCLPSAEISIY